MDAPQARPPPPPRPKPKPKPGELNSSRDNLTDAPSQPQFDYSNSTTASRTTNASVAPRVPDPEPISRPAPRAAPAPHVQVDTMQSETASAEVQPPKPKTVRKKAPAAAPASDEPLAAPKPLEGSQENLQADAQPAKKAPVKKKVVKKTPAAAAVSADDEIASRPGTNKDDPSTFSVSIAPQSSAGADEKLPAAKPRTTGAKKVVKKPPRPQSTELQMNAAAVKSFKSPATQPLAEAGGQAEWKPPQVEDLNAPTAYAPPPPSSAPPDKKLPTKTTRKTVKGNAAAAETRSREASPKSAPAPLVDDPYEQPVRVLPAPRPLHEEPTVQPSYGYGNQAPSHLESAVPDPTAYMQQPVPGLSYTGEDINEAGPVLEAPLEDPIPTLQPPASQPDAAQQKAAKGGIFSSLRQSLKKPKAPSKGKSNEPPEAFVAPPLPTREPGFLPPSSGLMPQTLHGSQPLLDVPNTGIASAAKTKSASAISVKATSGSMMQCLVILLDGEEATFEVPKRAHGRDLTDKVCDYLDLIERDYFALTYTSQKFDTWFWLHDDKLISKQVKDSALVFRFQVKFYPPDPSLLKEELSRYQLCLQLRQDLYYHKLPCSWVTQALLGSYMVQSELGDFDETQFGNTIDYLRSFAFVDGQNDELLAKIGELHRTHRGLAPAQSDIRFLENAKRLELYGVDLHAARDAADVELQVAVCHAGVVVYKNQLRLNRFAWPKVVKISYKKDFFVIRVRTDRFEAQQIDCSFRLANHKLAKRLWRYAIESHTFYRLKEPPKSLTTNSKSVTASMMSLISLGSSRGSQFRYSGRTLHQATATLGRSGTEAPAFERLATKRSTTGSMPNLSGNLGMSLGPAHNTQNTITGSMASLVLPPPRSGTMQSSRSLEMLSAGGGGRSMTLADNRSNAQAQQYYAPPAPQQQDTTDAPAGPRYVKRQAKNVPYSAATLDDGAV